MCVCVSVCIGVCTCECTHVCAHMYMHVSSYECRYILAIAHLWYSGDNLGSRLLASSPFEAGFLCCFLLAFKPLRSI